MANYDSERWKFDVGLITLLVFILLPMAVWILTGTRGTGSGEHGAIALQALLSIYAVLSFYGLLILAYAALRLGHILARRPPL